MSAALPRTAIIGAGSTGITIAKALAEHAIPYTCFEASDRIGGNWVFGNRNGMSAAYEGLHINTSRERMAYSDFPMPDGTPDFPHHSHIADYFDAYVDHFGLRDAIRFSCRVLHARPRDGGGWTLHLEDGTTEEFDALIVANGHHWDPRWPEPAFPGSDEFEGKQIHAHEYRSDELFRDRDVVVLGMGNSAMDLAVEASYVANRTWLAARRGAWVIPKYAFGRPIDQLGGVKLPLPIRRAILTRVVLAMSGRMERYGLPAPDHKLLDAHPTVSGRILDRLAHGAIVPKPNIARLRADTVEFADGTEVHADVVVYCTGYKITFPFFDEELVSAPENRIELYKRIFHPQHPDLCFAGLVQPLGALMPLAEEQGQLIGDYLTGRYELPPRGTMLSEIADDAASVRRRYVASKRHTIQVDFDDYLTELRRERKAGTSRAQAAGNRVPIPVAVAG